MEYKRMKMGGEGDKRKGSRGGKGGGAKGQI